MYEVKESDLGPLHYRVKRGPSVKSDTPGYSDEDIAMLRVMGTTAHRKGYVDANNLEPVSKNPYLPGSFKYIDYQYGHNIGRLSYEMRKAKVEQK